MWYGMHNVEAGRCIKCCCFIIFFIHIQQIHNFIMNVIHYGDNYKYTVWVWLRNKKLKRLDVSTIVHVVVLVVVVVVVVVATTF